MIRKALVKRGGQIVEVTIDDSTYKDGGSHGGLDRWFAEEWVDIKTGKPCGRQESENRKGYPACRPSKRVSSETPKTASELSQSEKAKFKRSKQSSTRIPYQHKRRQEGGEENSTFENFLEFIDPTGILSWDDANKAYNEWKNSNSTFPSSEQALDMFGAVPGLGKFSKLKYLDPNSIKKAYKSVPWQKILNAFDTAEDERSKIEKRIKKQKGGESNDKEMVDGIADILSQVEDMNNRKKIARNMLTDFRNEDVSFNYQDFLANSGLPELKSGGNKPTNPALWSRAKALARSKFDVYPSAYANGWAAKWYKGKGGGWRKAQMGGEEIFNAGSLPEFEITEDTGMYNPTIVGPSAPRYIPSEIGFIPNPYYTTGSGSAESVPLEMFAAPVARGLSSVINMIPQNVMTGLGAGAMLGLEGCAPGKKCKGPKAHPNYKKSWGKSKKRRRQEGGQEDFYIPDTGIEQFAPDQSWYEGNPNASAPGNIVSWPSYPKGTGIPISQLPVEEIPQRIAPSQGSIYLGTGRYATRPTNSMISLNNDYSRYQEDMPEYRNRFELFNRIGQGFNNMGEAIGNGFDNLGDFFKRMKKNRRKARRGRRGNGLLNCKPGTKCAKFQEGGEESDQVEELLDQIEDALERGAKREEVLLQLIEMGVDEEQAQALVEEAIQDLQEDAQEENNAEEKEVDENEEMYASGGSYRVYKTSERKGKTHKVVGPGGVTKYFGDPKLGERSKSKYGKKGFYARHKKNLAKNPFFRAYARATWAEGGEPTFMQEPEFKTNSFVDLIKSEAENNAYKNIMNQAQEMFMQMGGMTDYGYTGLSELSEMYQKNLNDLQSKGNVEGAVVNGLNKVGLALEKGIQMAANVVAPGSGALVGAAMDAGRPKSITDPTSKGFSAEGIGSMIKGLASDPQALAGLVARYGGSMRKFQTAGQTSVPGFSSDMSIDPWSNWGLNQSNITLPQQPQQYNIADQSLNTPALTATPDNLGVWSDDMTTYTPASFGPKNQMEQPGVSTEGTNPNKDPLLKPAVQQPEPQMPGGGINWLSIGKDIVTAMGYRGKAKKAEAKMADLNAADNVFAAAETLNRGKFERNTGKLIKQYTLGTNDGIPALARYGGNLRRAKHGGVQKDGVYLSYPTATPESVVYGEQPKKPSNTLRPVKREFANLEAEYGETVMTPATDGLPKFFKIGGNRHSQGGTPLNLPDGSFIFSDTRSMKIGGDILEELGIKGKKKRTPAEIAGILGKGYEKFVMTIQDPKSDAVERRTAELMIENQIKKLGQLALAQEAKKGFPEGIPMIAVPYMESVGIDPMQILPQPEMGMEELGNQQQMPQMSMQQMPMARYGLQKYQAAGQSNDNFFNSEYWRQRMLGASPISKAPEKSVWEQYPDAWNIFQAANQSRDINMIGKAEDYLNQIDVPFSIGFPGTDQDIIENAANTLRDRALMLERDYKKAKKEYEHNQNVNVLSTLKQQIIEIKKNTPKIPENIDKLNELDLAVKDLSVFSPSDIISKIDKYSYLVKNNVPKNQINKPTQEKINTVVQDTVPAIAAPVSAPAERKVKTEAKKTETKKKNKVTFSAEDLNDIQIIN